MQSLTTRIAIARQAVKGTAATTGFHTMYARMSQMTPAFDRIEQQNFHPGLHQRASTQNARPVRIAYTVPVQIDFEVHPSSLPVLLIGLGFTDSAFDNTGYYTHTFTKANVGAAVYLTAMQALGEGAGRFERRVHSIRGTQLTITADRSGLMGSFRGIGLGEVIAAGTETVTAEVAFPLLPTKGQLAWDSGGYGTPRRHVITIDRPVEEDDQLNHEFGRNDLSETGFGVSGEMTGIDLTLARYTELFWGGGASPAEPIITNGLDFTFASASNIASEAVPYSLNFDVALAELNGPPFGAQDANIVRGNLTWTMIDEVATAPLEVTVVNTIASY